MQRLVDPSRLIDSSRTSYWQDVRAKHTFTHPGSQIIDLIVTADHLISLAHDSDCAMVWDVPTGEHKFSLAHGKGIQCGAASPGGAELIISSYDFETRWDLHTGTELSRTKTRRDFVGGSHAIAYSPAARRLIARSIYSNLFSWGASVFTQNEDDDQDEGIDD